MAHNVMVKATPLRNVKGRIDYISNPKRQEHLVATYSSTDDPTFWKELAEHCQEQSKFSKSKKTVEGREHIIMFSNELSQMDPNELAKKVSDKYKERTGTENVVSLHWNKTHTNFHGHVVFSENKEENIVKESTTFDRNTYFDAEGKRSYKKFCRDENGELLPGCTFYKKGEQKVVVQRFGNKISELARPEWLKLTKFEVSKMQNELLQDERFKVFEHDGIHIPQQHVGNKIQDEDLKARIESKNKLIQEYNNAADQLIETAKKAEELQPNVYETWIDFLKKIRQEVIKMREKGNEAWLNAVKWALGRILSKTGQLLKSIDNKLKNKENELNTRTSLTNRLQDIEKRKPEINRGVDVPQERPARRKRHDLER